MEITVGELISMLAAYPKDKEMYFNGLQFYRFKDRGPYVQMEFAQDFGKDENGHLYVINHITDDGTDENT